MKKNNYIIIVLTLIVLVFLFVPMIRESGKKTFFKASTPAMATFEGSGNKIAKSFSFFSNIAKVRRQNEELSLKLEALQVDKSRIAELEYENKVLKDGLGFKEKNKEEILLPARIIGREPTSFLDYVIVDKGEEDGVKKGDTAVSSGVLVGQVSEVFPNSSKIVLVTSKDSLILAMLETSRSKGLLRGGISGLVLENITQDVSFEEGESVVTSGLDGEIKPGILIGKLGKIVTGGSDLYKNIGVEPVVDPSKLELIFILQ